MEPHAGGVTTEVELLGGVTTDRAEVELLGGVTTDRAEVELLGGVTTDGPEVDLHARGVTTDRKQTPSHTYMYTPHHTRDTHRLSFHKLSEYLYILFFSFFFWGGGQNSRHPFTFKILRGVLFKGGGGGGNVPPPLPPERNQSNAYNCNNKLTQ